MQVFYKILILVTILMATTNSFARESFFYDQMPFNRKVAAKLVKDSKLDYIFESIYNAAKVGECNLNIGPEYPRRGVVIINLDKNGIELLKKLGYEVTSDEKGGYLITWCD